MGNRRDHLVRFYSIIDRLEQSIGGARRLVDCSGRMRWPRRGVYFFREEGVVWETRGLMTALTKYGNG